MPSRTQFLVMKPWQGGLNTALDTALLTPDQLSIGNNVIFSNSGARKTRGGIKFWDYSATGVSRQSSGTNRILIVTPASNESFSVGQYIAIFRPDSSANTNYDSIRSQITEVDAVTYSPNVAISYTASTSLSESVTADTSIRVVILTNQRIVDIADFFVWNGSTRTHKRVAVTEQGVFYSYASDGARTVIETDSSISITTPLSEICHAIIDNKLVFAFKEIGNEMVYWDGTSSILPILNTDFSGTNVTSTNPPPDLYPIQVHQGRLWGIDKTTDRIHFSDVSTAQRWNGEGDSGGADLPKGDGDRSGTTSIFPSFKGNLPFAKNGQLYRAKGEAPLFSIEKISDGIGCVSHNSVISIDQDDLFFASRKGFHSFAASDAYGDFAGSYLSKDIQSDYNDILPSSHSYIRGVYLPTLNSAAWSVRESGSPTSNAIYLMNVERTGEGTVLRWYRWYADGEGIAFESIARFQEDDGDLLVFGTNDGTVLCYKSTSTKDLINTDITTQIKSGIIYPDGNPNVIKGFKRLGVLYKTAGSAVDFDINFQIDNFSEQSATITQSPATDLLGTTFTLGTSVMGLQEVLLPENLSVDGYGYGCTIEITSTSPINIYGYVIEFEAAGDQQEVIRS